MLKWLKNILIKLKLCKAEETAEAPRVNVRDIDFDEMNRRSELLRKLTEEQQIAIPNSKSPGEPLVCPACNEQADKIVRCVKCGKEICEGCGTYCSGKVAVDGADTALEGYYCEDCW